LPPSWDAYTQAYIAETRRHATRNPFKDMSSQEFIGVINAEAERRLGLQRGTNLAYSTKAKNNKGKGQSLLKRITSKLKDTKSNEENTEKKSTKLYCKHCKTKGHLANDCDKWDADPCTHCGRFNHESKDCWHKDKPKQDKGKAKPKSRKRPRNEETNVADSDSQHSAVTIEMTGDVAPGGIVFDSSEEGQHFNFADYDVTNFNGIDERTLYYDWLADSASTSHIVNRQDVFKTYKPVKDTLITGVGGLRVHAQGRGDVDVYMMHNRVTHTIHLHNVLYVPRNRNNLFSLGHWLANGGNFSGHDLALISKAGESITKGMLTANNLIKLRFRYAKSDDVDDAITGDNAATISLSTTQQLKGWDTWHRRFGHISYSGLRKLFDRELVTGFLVDRASSMSDCVACTEAKQSVIPFNKKGEHDTEPGDLTHVDVWGKYDVASINNFQYYLLLVDDTS
jgi:hypothetical protein